MKKIRRLFYGKVRAIERSTRRIRHELSPVRALFMCEALALGCVLLFMLTGNRVALLDAYGRRADLWMVIAAMVVAGMLHLFMNKRIASVLTRGFYAQPYDDRRILFDLGQAARGIATIEQLYKLVIEKIEEALHPENISIFVRDDKSGDYKCCVSSTLLTVSAMNRCLDQSDGDQLLLADDAFVVKRLRHLGVPLALEPRDLEAWTRALASAPIAEREARGREALTLRRINSRLLLQIMMKDKLVGVISLGSRRDGRSFSEEDKRLLMSVAGQMAFIIENTKLFGRMVEDERLRRELALAAEVQQRLFPSVPPATRALELAGFCQPARGIGGDYYDFLELDNGQIGVAVADVAGKGIAAALLMSMVQASLRSQAMMQDQTLKAETALAYLVSTMNHLLWRSTDAASYATFFYAQFDETQRRLTYVNAGHNPPFLLRVGGVESSVETPATSPYHDHPYDKQQAACALAVQPKVEIAASATMPGDHCASSTGARLLTTGGPVIGVFEDCLYRQETVELEHGDLIVAYTDGVTEALNIEGEEFGEERLQETLAASMNFPADEVRDYVIERVRRWSAGAPQHDDLTFVVVKVK